MLQIRLSPAPWKLSSLHMDSMIPYGANSPPWWYPLLPWVLTPHSGLPYQLDALSVSNKPSQLPPRPCIVLLDAITFQHPAWFTSLYCHPRHPSQASTLCFSSSPGTLDAILIPFKIQRPVLGSRFTWIFFHGARAQIPSTRLPVVWKACTLTYALTPHAKLCFKPPW